MIIKGKSRAGASELASHLLRTDTNEKVKTIEVRGTIAQDVQGALLEMAAIASGSMTKKFIYHVSISPRSSEQLTPEQWQQSVNVLEKNLGFDGHQRIIVEHIKAGRKHYHVVFQRINCDTMKAVSDSHNYRIHERTARDLERTFNLSRVQGVHVEREKNSRRPERSPFLWELDRSKAGKDLSKLKSEINGLWNSTNSANDFVAALEYWGYRLAKGDRCEYCIVDPTGYVHSLVRRLKGVNAADVRSRMGGYELKSLKDVRISQLDRNPNLKKKQSSSIVDNNGNKRNRNKLAPKHNRQCKN